MFRNVRSIASSRILFFVGMKLRAAIWSVDGSIKFVSNPQPASAISFAFSQSQS